MRLAALVFSALWSATACGSHPDFISQQIPSAPPPPLASAPPSPTLTVPPSTTGQAGPSLVTEPPPVTPAVPRAGTPVAAGVARDLTDLPVVHSELPARPILGGTLLVYPSPHRAVVADPDRDLLSVVDLESDALMTTLSLEPGDQPARLAMGAGTTVVVALRGGGALAVVDVETGTLLSRLPTCAGPRGLTYDAQRRWIVVACHGGEVLALDDSTYEVAWRTIVQDDLRDVVVVSGQYWVSRLKTAELLRVDPDDAEAGAAFVPDTILPPDGTLPRDGTIPSSPGVHEPRVLRRLFLDGNGDVVMQHQRANQGQLVTQYYGRDLEGTGAIAHGAVTTFVPATQTFTPLGALPNAQIYDLAFSGDGLRMAAVSTNAYGSTLHEALLLSRSELSPTAIGDWTSAEVPGQATAVAYDMRGRLLVQSREPALLQVIGGTSLVLSEESRFDTGHVLFHASTPSGLACASCHPEGGEDGVTWNFASGRRQTAPLYIGVSSTLPLHWQGELQGMPALMRDTMTRMQGTLPSDAQSQAVGVWLDGLLPPVAAPVELDETQRLGQQVFLDAGCAVCHSGDRFTDNREHDVGTGGEFQTPSLVGLRHSAPYLHDGCAKTLAQRFDDACGGTAHGEFWNLTEEQFDQLLAYLAVL